MQEPEARHVQGKECVGSRALVGPAMAVLILYVIGLAALGTPPGAAATGEQVVAWFREHHQGDSQ